MNPNLQEELAKDFTLMTFLVMLHLRNLSNRNIWFSYESWSFQAKTLGPMPVKKRPG